MSSEYFVTIEESVQVLADEKRSRDFQEFVIALVFCKKFDSTSFAAAEEVQQAIREFQSFIKPIRAIGVDNETLLQIRERAVQLNALLQGKND